MKYFTNQKTSPTINNLFQYAADGSQDKYILPELTPITEEEAKTILVQTSEQQKLEEDRNLKDLSEAKAYAKLKALYGMSPTEIQTWTTANVTTIAQARDAITTLAIAVSVLMRRI